MIAGPAGIGCGVSDELSCIGTAELSEPGGSGTFWLVAYLAIIARASTRWNGRRCLVNKFRASVQRAAACRHFRAPARPLRGSKATSYCDGLRRGRESGDARNSTSVQVPGNVDDDDAAVAFDQQNHLEQVRAAV